MNCLKCEKKMEFHPQTISNVNDGGEMNVTFHYGSRHDMCLDFDGRCGHMRDMMKSDNDRVKTLTSCNKITAYICDDCFTKHSNLFIGENVIQQPPKIERII